MVHPLDRALKKDPLAVLKQCQSCGAKCCTYITVQIDDPGNDLDEYEAIRWYLTRPNVSVFVDEGDWYLQIDEKCRFLQADHSCGNYEHRPAICADYDPRSCEYWDAPDASFDMEFRSLEAFDAWYHGTRKPEIERRLARAKAKRARAARKAAAVRWAKAGNGAAKPAKSSTGGNGKAKAAANASGRRRKVEPGARPQGARPRARRGST